MSVHYDKPERTYLVHLRYAYRMCHPGSISLGTRRQSAILWQARRICGEWRRRSQMGIVAIGTEREVWDFLKILSNLRCGGYYERNAQNEIRYLRNEFCMPYPTLHATGD